MATESERADKRREGVVGLSKSSDGKTDWAAKVYDTIARTDRDTMVRCAALRALAPCVAPEHVDTCLKLLRSPDHPSSDVLEAPPMVRWNSAKLLLQAVKQGQYRDDQQGQICETLIARMPKETDQNAMVAMIETLGHFPERRVLDALIAALAQDNFTIQHEAELSLATLTGVTHDHDPDAWSAWLAQTEDPFAGAGQMPPSLANSSREKRQWDWLGWMN